MKWHDQEIDFRMEGEDDDPDFVRVYDGWCRTSRESRTIDLDELKHKKNKTKREEFEERLIEHILDHEKQAH